MLIKKTNITPRQAAEEFAEQYSEEGRTVGNVLNGVRYREKLRFQFVGGARWYSVFLTPDFSGYEIVLETDSPTIN